MEIQEIPNMMHPALLKSSSSSIIAATKGVGVKVCPPGVIVGVSVSVGVASSLLLAY